MIDSDGPKPEIDSKPEENPRFLKAVTATEKFLKSASQDEIRSYFDNPSSLGRLSQDFDVVTGSSAVNIKGDTSGLVIEVAKRLQEAISQYQGPTAIVEIYTNIYNQPISEILGE